MIKKALVGLVLFLGFWNPMFSQTTAKKNLFRNNYDKVFPNNKTIQINRLVLKNDSLSKALEVSKSEQNEILRQHSKNLIEMEMLNNLLKEKAVEFEERTSDCSDSIRLLKDSISTISFPIVKCKEEVLDQGKYKDPIFVNKCRWHNYEIIETGFPSINNTYKWQSEVYKIQVDTLIKCNNIDLFKLEKKEDLEKLIFERASDDFNALKEAEPRCFKNKKLKTNFPLESMRILFLENEEIAFEIQFDLNPSCLEFNATSVIFKIQDLKEYFKTE